MNAHCLQNVRDDEVVKSALCARGYARWGFRWLSA